MNDDLDLSRGVMGNHGFSVTQIGLDVIAKLY
jgi:hypothetical protein